jgi:hypothetical protein
VADTNEGSIRDDLAAAMGESTTTTAVPEPAVATSTSEPAKAAPEPVEAEKAPAEGRDEKGRFSPKAKPQDIEAKPAETTTEAAKAAPPVPVEAKPVEAGAAPVPVRAPSSWKPEAREEWAKLPPKVQEEVLRVDREVRKTMQESAQGDRGALRGHDSVGGW